MKAASFDYVRPRDVSEALAAVKEAGTEAKFLAGGQSLAPMLNLRLARPKLLIDICRLDQLNALDETPGAWSIGAAVTHARLEDSKNLRGAAMLIEVAAGIAYRSVRNRGTIGGSLAHADPAADWPLALAALGATIHVRNSKGNRRSFPAADFMTMAFTTRLADDELIESISVPKLSSDARYGYFKFCRKTGEFPEANAAAVFDPDQQAARVFMGASRGSPRSLPQVAETIARKGSSGLSIENVAQAVKAAEPALDSIETKLHATVVCRAIERAMA